MHIIKTLSNTKKQALALTIGNFDGVHIGHQAILQSLVTSANQLHLTPAAMTFSPHAKALFQNCDNFLINNDAEKANLIAAQGIEYYYEIPFDKNFATTKAEFFIDQLIHELNVRYLLVGDDFRFGHKGQGNFEMLASFCASHGIVVNNTPTIRYKNNRVSSSRVRDAITHANFTLATELLGRPLRYTGKVIDGKKLGRTIDFPTANIRLPRNRLLPQGVFAVHAICEDGSLYSGMCNIGNKPTVDTENIRQIETHLFDFNDDIYGQQLSIELVAKIRDEKKFNSLDALIAQLHKDKSSSLQLLS